MRHTIRDGGFTIDKMQHKEWFISMLLPHLHQSLNQLKIATQDEDVEIAMKLEASHVLATKFGAQKIQIQLVALHLEIQTL